MVQSAEFKANGKLLITGEYLVLHAARALALPLRFGQRMCVTPIEEPFIRWVSEDANGVWLTGEFDPLTFKLYQGENPQECELHKLQFISELLQYVKSFNHSFPFINEDLALSPFKGIFVHITANYPLEWGIGSSSTLLSLLAQWADIDVFELFRKVSNGSGYDVISATQYQPFFYKLSSKPENQNSKLYYEVKKATPGFALRNFAYFGYLGNKQDSHSEVKAFLKSGRNNPESCRQISELAEKICYAATINDLMDSVLDHERIIAKMIGKQPVGAVRFADLPVVVKSLGAWGGDFAMFVSDLGFDELQPLLASKGVQQLFTFNNICI